MINSKKGIIIAVVLILLLAAGTFLVIGIGNNDTDNAAVQSPEDAYTVVAENAEDISEITVDSADIHLTAVRRGVSDWTINNLSSEEVSSAKAYELAGTVSNIMSKNAYDATGDPAEYGLAEPFATVTIKKNDGSEIKLLIGDKSPTSGEYFVMLSGGNKIYTIYEHKVISILQPLSYYTEFNRWGFDITDVTGILIERGGEKIELRVKDEVDEYSGVVWEMISPYEGNANDEYIDSKILAQLECIELTAPIDNADGGFNDNSAYVTLTITPYDSMTGEYGDQYTETIVIGKSEGDKTYVKHKDKVYMTDTENVSFADDLAFNIISKLQALVNISRVKSVTIDYDGKTHKMDVTHERDNKYSFKLDGADVDSSGAQNAYENLISLSVDAVYDGSPVKDEVLKITYEGIDSADNTVVTINRIDDINCALERNGRTDFTIRYSKIKEFTDSFEAYASGETR